MLEHQVTVLFATPTYALHLAEVARQENLDLPGSSVRAVVVAGEPGGAIASTRQLLESSWGARVFDHYGLTEVGPLATEAVDHPAALEVLDSEYIAEVIEPNGTQTVADGEIGELVVTNLGRLGSPLIRYRTGDLVRRGRNERGTVLLGGVLGRTDEMLHIRGNNVYPTALEAIIRRFPEVVEFRINVDRTGPLTELLLEIEAEPDHASTTLATAIQQTIQDELLFRAELRLVPSGTLPRFEMKARRVIQRLNS
jgi:phenylacetate-CoA ligase